MKRMIHCLFLDLKDDPKLIEEYEKHHKNVWPEVVDDLHKKGITELQIFRAGNRLAMVIHVDETFSFDAPDAANEVVHEWERLMWKYQQPLPFARPGEKWVRGEVICEIKHDSRRSL